jgi:hypothetical protein
MDTQHYLASYDYLPEEITTSHSIVAKDESTVGDPSA